MERTVVGFAPDDAGDWTALLSCGHRQHVRHRPPMELRPWVLTEGGRASRLGMTLNCVRCDDGELPKAARLEERSPDFTESSPELFSRELEFSRWAVLRILEGRLDSTAITRPEMRALSAGESVTLVPNTPYRFELRGPVRFYLDYYELDFPQSI